MDHAWTHFARSMGIGLFLLPGCTGTTVLGNGQQEQAEAGTTSGAGATSSASGTGAGGTGTGGCTGSGCTLPDCEEIFCNIKCAYGLLKDANGCAICECALEPCTTPNPQGCANGGCPSGEVCDLSQSCVPSSCSCNLTGEWDCTADCGGGVCVPQTACGGPNPAGCERTGCPVGKECVDGLFCTASSCDCNPDTGDWSCTDDCGGGFCVEVCGSIPNPAGCVQNGCPVGMACDTTVGCASSGCGCETGSETWTCLPDCGGGTCVPIPGG